MLRLGALLWVEGPSNSADDLKKRWIFSKANDQSLELWLHQLHGEGVRELMRAGRETGDLLIYESKTTYLARTRTFFHVSENAFILINRAAGLKQLNSIDEIFRDLVLDDCSAFDRALEVAGEFDNLAGIHSELETARRQRDSLSPIAREYERLLKERDEVDRWQTLKRIVHVWFAIVVRKKWLQELETLATARGQLQAELFANKELATAWRSQVDALRERYLQLGGNTFGELENTIAAQKKLVTERNQSASEYRRIVKMFKLSDELNQETFIRNQIELGRKQQETQVSYERQFEEMVAARAQQQQLEQRRDEVALAIKRVKERPGSNIPMFFQDFRTELAARLSLPEGNLPFLAELVEVKPEEAAWRGAIERAIGGERQRIIVPGDRIDEALNWVNSRHNRLHVRLEEALSNERSVSSFNDGYARKLNFKTHPLQATARRLVNGRDRHCVSSPEMLKRIEYGMTVEGLTSGQKGRFDKQDQRRLDEDWMTGFDNKDQLDALSAQLRLNAESLRTHEDESAHQSRAYKQLEQQLALINAVLGLEFSKIDSPRAESELANSENRLALLLSPRSDASQAKAEYEKAEADLKVIESQVSKVDREVAVLDSQRSTGEMAVRRSEQRIGSGLPEDELALAQKTFDISTDVAVQDLADSEREAAQQIDAKLDAQVDRVSQVEKTLVRQMGFANTASIGALSDVGTDVEDIPHYLERLRVLTEEALPEKQKEFLEYLNRSSDQGVTQLLSRIDSEVDTIEHRIHALNQTLAKIDFRSGRYLQLQPQRLKHESLRTLETAIRKVRTAALKEDEGESHYKALREVVEILRDAGQNRRQVGARALLDPRYRLQFFVVEVDRQTGGQSPPRTGSQSGSGGEKELMASHILTASLSYALCPAGANQPLYGTVILDEAFSKSSPSAAGRIIEALRVFRLHPIFVTPNKEIGLLKQHTRKVICVQRPGKKSTLASITWEKLDELARQS